MEKEIKVNKIFLWIFAIISFILLASSFIIPFAIFGLSAWWGWSTLIILGTAWLIYGIVLLIKKLIGGEIITSKIAVGDAKRREIEAIKYDEDNPDNFLIEKTILERHGEKGKEPTPILVLKGYGTEKKQKRFSIINLNNPKEEFTRLIDPKQEEIERSIRLMAENPSEEIIEEVRQSFEYGVPITTTKRKLPSSQKLRDEQEKKQLEEKTAI